MAIMPLARHALTADALQLSYGVQEMTTIEAREPALTWSEWPRKTPGSNSLVWQEKLRGAEADLAAGYRRCFAGPRSLPSPWNRPRSVMIMDVLCLRPMLFVPLRPRSGADLYPQSRSTALPVTRS
jgi:hypothetical protein